MKNTFALVIAIMLGLSTLSSCGSNKPETVKNQPEKPTEASTTETVEINNDTTDVDWADIYADYIIDNKSDFTEEVQPTIAYIGVNDLNFDGVPELIVSGAIASAAYYFNIFHIKDGIVEQLEFTDSSGDKLSLYSRFFDGWITLRKNADNGSLKYVLISENGGSDESFGNVISICQDPNDSNKFKITNEFEYVDYWATPDDNKYYVAGAKVSASEYDVLQEDFYKTWQDTEFTNYAMLNPDLSNSPNIYKKTIPVSTDKQELKNFFAMYQPEN